MIKDRKTKIDDDDDELHSNSVSGDDVDIFCMKLFQHPLSLKTNASVEINVEATVSVEAVDASAEMKAVVSATQEPMLRAMPVESEALDLKMSPQVVRAVALAMMTVFESHHSLTTHDMSVMKVVLAVVVKHYPKHEAVASYHHAFSPTSQSIHHRYMTWKIVRTPRQCPCPLPRPVDSG